MGGKSSSSSASTTKTTTQAIDRRIGTGDGSLIATEGSTITAPISFESADPAAIEAALNAALGFAAGEGAGSRALIANNVGDVLDFAQAESGAAFELVGGSFDRALDFAATESAGARSLTGKALDVSSATFEQALAEIGKSRGFAADALNFAGQVNQSAFDFQSTVGDLGGLKELLKNSVSLAAIAAVALIFTRRAAK